MRSQVSNPKPQTIQNPTDRQPKRTANTRAKGTKPPALIPSNSRKTRHQSRSPIPNASEPDANSKFEVAIAPLQTHHETAEKKPHPSNSQQIATRSNNKHGEIEGGRGRGGCGRARRITMAARMRLAPWSLPASIRAAPRSPTGRKQQRSGENGRWIAREAAARCCWVRVSSIHSVRTKWATRC